jgi:hypothetical protein
MTQSLNSLLSQRDIRVGARQLDLLYGAIGDGPATMLDAALQTGTDSTIVIDEPPGPAQVEALCQSLQPAATVVIPFGENPAFDFIKSRLRCRGTIGACAPESPHQIWWGGSRYAPVEPCASILQGAHIVSSVRRRTPEDRAALRFEHGLDALGISHTVQRTDSYIYCDTEIDLRSRQLLAAWETTDKPLIWIDASGGPDLSTLSVNLTGADFSAIPTTESRFSTSLLYFARTSAAHALLRHWNKLCREFPNLTADYLLDAAWAMISSQRHLVTAWMTAEERQPVINAVNLYPGYPFDLEARQIASPTATQREARRSGRTGAPEPICISKGKLATGKQVTMVTTSNTVSAHQVAATVNSALDAFDADDGLFGLFGIIVCRTETEAVQVIEGMTDGWIFYVLPGTQLPGDTFNLLAEHLDESQLLFMMPEPYANAQTSTGIDLAATRSKALFGRSAQFAKGVRSQAVPQLSLLKINS